ncbi:PilZ domain-containing protein [Erythrobacter sp. MTPC3]|uniref:PilZ domain-containing protein n=1 Tax=Erythrobacter sp. MTPC3 TaxID=3056564 RepID=UPI0036F20E53
MQTRQTSRKTISLPGRFYTGAGQLVDVTLSELSVGGCRFAAPGKALIPGTPLQVYIGASGPHRANVRWSENGEVGVTFAAPFTQPQIDAFENGEEPGTPGTAQADTLDQLSKAKPHRFC